MFPHNNFLHTRTVSEVPETPDFWEEVHTLTTEPIWQSRCASTEYGPPTDSQIILDLASAIQLGLRPRFAGSPAWARHLLRHMKSAVTQTPIELEEGLATVHQIGDARARIADQRQPETLVQH